MTEEVAELTENSENTGEAVENEDSATSEVETEETQQPEEKPKAKGVQRRIDELTSNWRTAERDRDYWRDLAIKGQQAPEKPQEAPQPQQGKPDVNQFDSYDAYLDALADWKVEERLQAIERERTEASQRETRSQAEMKFRAREASFTESHPDYGSVVGNPALPITEDMYNAALSSEKGPEILYHLGQNPELAAQVAGMSTVQQAMELGRIEATLSRPARNQTKAPEPVAPVAGGGGNAASDPDNMTADEWRVWRDRQVQERQRST